jgi:hypothetical protein
MTAHAVSRTLTAMERSLAADAPLLASRFALFNRLAAVAGPVTAEQLPGPPRWGGHLGQARRNLRPAHVTLLLALLAIAVVCFTLTTRTDSGSPRCTPATAAARAAQASSAPVRYTSAQTLTCPAYSANRQAAPGTEAQ